MLGNSIYIESASITFEKLRYHLPFRELLRDDAYRIYVIGNVFVIVVYDVKI